MCLSEKLQPMQRSRMHIRILLLAHVLAMIVVTVYAQSPSGSGLPVPRFVSLRASEANMRAGPGEQYPIKWTYRRAGLPFEVVQEYQHWRQVRDWQGTEGWMHSSMLSGKRSVIVTGNVRILRAEADPDSAVIARIEGKVVGRLKSCPHNLDWCYIQFDNVAGWLRRNEIWGVFSGEEVG